jgi:hypothetical protein
MGFSHPDARAPDERGRAELSEPDDLSGDGAIGCHLVDVAPRHAPPSLAR